MSSPDNTHDADFADHLDEVLLWSAPFGLKLLECVDYKHNVVALDLGCGTGFPVYELAMRLGPTSEVIGLDPWKEGLSIARRKNEHLWLNNVKLVEGVGENIPFVKDHFDLIVSNNGINNVDDMNKTFAECARVLKEGGQFVFTMNLDTTMKEFYDVFEKVLHDNGMEGEVQAMHDHIYEKRRPLSEINSLLEENGFEVHRMRQDQFTYQFTDAQALFTHYFMRIAFIDAWTAIVPQDRVDEIFQEITNRLNEEARTLGHLVLTVPYVVIDARKRPL